MELSFEILAVALAVLALNVMDSVTTHLCFRQYPDEELKGEANPIMRWLMLKNKWLAEVFKQTIVLGAILFVLFGDGSVSSLRYLAILLTLVVLNNTYVFVSRAVARRRIATPFTALTKLCPVPDRYSYGLIIVVLFVLASVIYGLVWG